MREFTPGKWKVLKNEKYPFWYVRQEGMESVIATANAEADARLIAAAPEMYRILHEVLNWSKDEDFDTDIEEDIFEVFSHIDSKEATHANELKVCPFCGNEPDVEYKTDGKDWVRVVCPRCGGNSGWYMFESMAKDAWNRRFQE